MIKIEYDQIIKELYDKILTDTLKHRNTVIIGDNSTGKTTLLKVLFDNLDNSLFINCPFDKELIKNIDNKVDILLIDNLETILEYKDILCINNLLKELFSNKKVIIATHNLELIARLRDFNIICMHKDLYSIHDGNDFNSFDDAKNLIDFNKSSTQILLTHLLGLKISNLWTEIEEDRLNQLKDKSLTPIERLILNQII